MKLVVDQSYVDIDNYLEDVELLKLSCSRWPINCRYCGKKGDLTIEQFQFHEDTCRGRGKK